MPTVSIFVSYSHEDNRWFAENSLIPWLAKSLKRDGVEIWWDRDGIAGGDPWRRKIEEEIDRAHIALLLVSQGFLNSEFIEQVELPRIRARAERNELVVIPILTEPCEWDEHEFISSRQMVPGKAIPLINFVGHGKEAEWAQARFEILSTIKKRLRSLASARSTAQSAEAALPETAPVPDELLPGKPSRRLGGWEVNRLLVVAAPLALLVIIAGVWLNAPPQQQVGGAPGTATPVASGIAPAPGAVSSPAAAIPPPTPRPSLTATPAAKPGAISATNATGVAALSSLSGHAGPVRAVAYSRDGNLLASGSADKTVKIWDVASVNELRTVKLSSGVSSLAFSSDGRLLVVGSDGGPVYLVNVVDGAIARTLAGHEGAASGVASSADGQTVASGSSASAENSAKLRNVGDGRELHTFYGQLTTSW